MKQFIPMLLLLFTAGLAIGVCLLSLQSKTPSRQSLPLSALYDSNMVADEVVPEKKSVKILFGGDLMFDRSIRQKLDTYGQSYSLDSLRFFFNQHDVVVANLEGPITDFTSVSLNSEPGSKNNFIFTFSPLIIPMLQEMKLTVLNLGNNHIGNFGVSGIAQTKTYLQQANLSYFGDTGSESGSQERVSTRAIGQQLLVFVNYNQFITLGLEHALEDLAYAQSIPVPKGYIKTVIIYTHWGNEYVLEANSVIQSQAHQLIDAGADLVIGSHPHVIQQKEEYKGAFIYYSLGNFVFDQYFSPETQQGLLVSVEITASGEIIPTEIPIQLLPNGQTVASQE